MAKELEEEVSEETRTEEDSQEENMQEELEEEEEEERETPSTGEESEEESEDTDTARSLSEPEIDQQGGQDIQSRQPENAEERPPASEEESEDTDTARSLSEPETDQQGGQDIQSRQPENAEERPPAGEQIELGQQGQPDSQPLNEADTLLNKARDLLNKVTTNSNNYYMTIRGYAEFIQEMGEIEKGRMGLPSIPGNQQYEDIKNDLDEKFRSLMRKKQELESQIRGEEEGEKKEERAHKLLVRKKDAERLTERLNSKYKEETPIIGLIRKVKRVDDGTDTTGRKEGKVFAAIDKGVGFVNEHVMGNAMGISDGALSMTYGSEDKKNSTISALGVLWDVLVGNKSMDDASKETSKEGQWFGFFAPVIKIYLFCRHIHKYFKAQKKSHEEKIEGIEGLVGESLSTLISGVSPVVQILGSSMGPWGAILGLINNAVSVVLGALSWSRASKHRKDADRRKAEIKKKMAEKRLKYQQSGLKDANGSELLEFIGMDGKILDRGQLIEQQRVLNQTWGSENIYQQMGELRKKKFTTGLDPQQKEAYYQMKTYRMIQEYRELKEAKYVNKKRIRNQAIGLIHTAVDVTKNILKLIPNITVVAGAVLGIANSASKWIHKGITKIRNSEKHRNEKSEKRNAMANDMFNQMIFVEGYMNPEGEAEEKGTFKLLDGETNGMLEQRMEYLSGITDSLGYRFSIVHKAVSKDDLLEKMASAFSTGG